MSVKGILSISFLNFKEAVRNKLFLGIVFFFAFYLFFCVFCGQLSVGHTDKVLRNTGLAGIEITAVVLMIFSFIFSFYREKDSRILDVYLSNFQKSTYLCGKLTGYFFILLVYLFFCAISLTAVLYLYQSFNAAVIAALYPLLLKMCIIVCWASLLSCLFSSSIVALLATLFFYASSLIAPAALKTMSSGENLVPPYVIKALYLMLPNMDKFDINYMVVWGDMPPYHYFGWVTVYACAYILCVYLVNLFMFSKKEW